MWVNMSGIKTITCDPCLVFLKALGLA